jgi:GNAT superfamily N-acetyltransferase
MSRRLETQVTEFFDCDVTLSATRLDAQQLREFADAQMPRTGIGEVPWSTPLSSDQLAEFAATGKAEFVTARMMLAVDGELPLIGIGALIRNPDIYLNPRMIVVVHSEFRGLGIGNRIAKELLDRLDIGEVVQAEVQQESLPQRRTAKFFEALGFECVEEKYRAGDVPEYFSGEFTGTVQKDFALYSFTK